MIFEDGNISLILGEMKTNSLGEQQLPLIPLPHVKY